MNEIALITGGGSGIGYSLAKKCIARDMQVILLDKNFNALQQAQNDLEGKVFPIQVDLNNSDELKKTCQSILNEIGIPKYLFNNAGIGGPSKPLWEQSESEIRDLFEVNFFSAFLLTKLCLTKMMDNKVDGAIINTASMASFYTAPLIGNYVISKHAILAFSECLYHDLKSVGSNIQIAVVCPGGVKTTILENQSHKIFDEYNIEQQHFLIKFAKLIKKGTEPDVIAEIIFSGLEHKQFYIFTHPQMLPIIETRLAAIIEQKDPQPLQI